MDYFVNYFRFDVEIIKGGIKKSKNAQKSILTIELSNSNRKRNLNWLKLA